MGCSERLLYWSGRVLLELLPWKQTCWSISASSPATTVLNPLCFVFHPYFGYYFSGRHVFIAMKWLDTRRAACAVSASCSHTPVDSLPHCRRAPLPVSTMGRPSAPPADGGGAVKPNTKGGGKGGVKGGSKAGGKKTGAKAGGGSAPPTAAATPAPPTVLLPSLPVPILKLSLAVPSPLAAPSASSCGGAALDALSAALADVAGRPQPTGDVRRTLGGAVAEWVKALGGVGDGGGGGVVDNVGRYVAAEISALPADEEGGSGAAGDASADDAGALGEVLCKKLHEFGERRIGAACQAVGAVVAESVLQSGDEVVVWGVGSQPEVVAALERSIAAEVPFRLTVVTSASDAWTAAPQSFLSLPFPTHTPTVTLYEAAASAFGFSSARSLLLLPARFVASNGAVVTARGGGGLAVAAKRRGAVVAVLTVSLAFGADGRLRERRPWPCSSAGSVGMPVVPASGTSAGAAEDVIDPQWIDFVVSEHGVIAPAMAPRVDKTYNSFA